MDEGLFRFSGFFVRTGWQRRRAAHRRMCGRAASIEMLKHASVMYDAFHAWCRSGQDERHN